jgi:serine/threonine protein kinase
MSPRNSINAIHPQMVMNKLKPVKDDFLHYVESQDSISQLCICVNDSAGDKTFDQCYDKQDVLGDGGFAVVYRCQHKERGNLYAVKEIADDCYACDGENLKEEIDALKRLREVPYIVRLLDVFQNPDRSYLIMEEMKGGDLLARLTEKGAYSEADSRRISRRLLEAIYYCHKKEVVHRDIKPENILLASKAKDTDIKLADFGCAKRLTSPNCLHTLCGTTLYVAPELYTHQDGYDERCDLWSAAVVIYVILGGYAPFEGTESELPAMICEGWFCFHHKYWEKISKPPKDLIRSLLEVDLNERASLEDALDSEWLRRRDRESVSRLSMNGSTSTFDAWLRSQNESSLGHSWQFHIEEEETDTEDTSRSQVEGDEETEDSSRSQVAESNEDDADDSSRSQVGGPDDSCRSLALDEL